MTGYLSKIKANSYLSENLYIENGDWRDNMQWWSSHMSEYGSFLLEEITVEEETGKNPKFLVGFRYITNKKKTITYINFSQVYCKINNPYDDTLKNVYRNLCFGSI